MGLDQNWIVKTTKSIAYHRKFNALQGFMEDIWRSLGNEGEFNCEDVRITDEILDELEERVEAGTLEPRGGFFFGDTNKDEYYLADIKELKEEVIPKVRKRMAEGDEVYYTSWW